LLFNVGLKGFEAVEWERMIAETKHHTQPVVNGEWTPLVLVEGTMVLNYRFLLFIIIIFIIYYPLGGSVAYW